MFMQGTAFPATQTACPDFDIRVNPDTNSIRAVSEPFSFSYVRPINRLKWNISVIHFYFLL